MDRPSRPRIAIVGMGGVFPGAPDLDRFFALISERRVAVQDVGRDRWTVDPDRILDPRKGTADRVYSKRACLIDDFTFDPVGYALEPSFLRTLDPSCHLLLAAGRAAWANTVTTEVDLARAGVVVGHIALPTDGVSQLAWETVGPALTRRATRAGPPSQPLHRYVAALPACVLARALGLGGGAWALDAACASSLYALDLAVDELVSGRADLMLTGGVSRPDSLYTQMGFAQLNALSARGTPAPFDETGDGLVVGEGAGVLVLKRLADALAHGDRILGTIAGIGLSNDLEGRLLAPSSEGQIRAMRAAYRESGWSPDQVDLIECHATGTPLGDGVEVASLRTLWEGSRGAPGGCPIGSVKSNVGHLLTAAGAAGLIKTLLAMGHQCLLPTATFRRPAPSVALDGSPFRVQVESAPWPARGPGVPRRAAVSAFGFGGINAHVLIEEFLPVPQPRKRNGVQGAKLPGRGVEAKPPRSGSECPDLPPSEHPIDPSDPIAIVGMATRFGGIASLSEFQRAVLMGLTPDPRPPDASRWWRLTGPPGHYLDDLSVPVGRFRIPPREQAEMLPQQMLMLEVAAGALADAGAGGPSGERTGIVVGLGLDLNTTNFHLRWRLPEGVSKERAGPPLTANRTMGALASIVASRIARELRFGGPSFALSSEDTSGLRALTVAVRALQNGRIERAVVGAVDLAGDVRSVLATGALRAWTHAARVRPLDPAADGTLPGEGAAAIVLERLSVATARGARVYAVLRGLGAATGGGIDGPVPTVDAYRNAFERALTEARTTIEGLTYIELSGTGVPASDGLEAQALSALARTASSAAAPRQAQGQGHAQAREQVQEQTSSQPGAEEQAQRHTSACALGSVKATIGHTGAVAGLAGVVKTALCLYQEMLPASTAPERVLDALTGCEWTTTRGADGLPGIRFHLPRAPQFWYWDRALGPRQAAVADLGLDGNCLAAVLEGPEALSVRQVGVVERIRPLGPHPEALFAVEGPTVTALLDGLAQLKQWLGQRPAKPIEALARLWHARLLAARADASGAGLALAVAFVARDAADLTTRIDEAASHLRAHPDQAAPGPRVFFSPAPLGPEAPIAFVFPGSGSHYPGMGLDVGAWWPQILRVQHAANENLRRQMVIDRIAPWRLAWPPGWEHEAERALASSPWTVILGQVCHGTVVSDLVRSLGVEPVATIGYSLGETAALFATGAWRDRDAMMRRMERSDLFTRQLAGPCDAARAVFKLPPSETVDWTIGVVDRSEQAVRKAIGRRDRVFVLIRNTPDECVIGGDSEQVAQVVAALGAQFVPVDGVSTVHCKVVKRVRQAYRTFHLLPTTPPEHIRFYSGASGTAIVPDRESAADAILGVALDTLDFPRVIERAYADGIRIFLEVGPGGTCTRMIGKILDDRPHLARSACARGQPQVVVVLRLLAALIAERVPIDLDRLYGGEAPWLAEPRPLPTPDAVTVWLGPSPETIAALDAVHPAPEASPTPPPPLAPPAPPGPAATTPGPNPGERPAVAPVGAASGTASGMTRVKTGASFVISDTDLVPSSPAYTLAPMVLSMAEAAGRAHGVYLSLAGQALESHRRHIAFQARLIEALGAAEQAETRAGQSGSPGDQVGTPSPHRDALTRAQCLTFATGRIADVLGPFFAQVDTYPTRVRLPDEPLMLVDRIIAIEGEKGSLTRGTVVTEHDVLPGAWYLDGGRIPTCIAVEAGQADLFLSGFLGVDGVTRGLACYRLLDAVVTFHRELPGPGATIRYVIHIDRFSWQGDTVFFHFNFESTVDGQALLSMRDGCAGFFTPRQLDEGRGIVLTQLDGVPMPGVRPADWEDLVPMAEESYDEAQVDALRRGDLAGCFGPAFARLDLGEPMGLPSGRMRLVHRVVSIEPGGGRYGLGRIRAQADIHPEDWFLTCHFVDDPVMPGTLMYECCLHTLRILLMRMGWVARRDEVVLQPVPGVSGKLKCRGQVLASTRVVTYDVSIKEVGFRPEPYAIADALMSADGKPIVLITNMSLRLSGLTRERLTQIWQHRAAKPTVGVRGEAACSETGIATRPLFDRASILAFAVGKPSEAFGEPYRVFDSERVIARLPGPPYMFLDRITELANARPFVLEPGGVAVAQYDVPRDAWYFEANRQASMPFSVLLEVALQPCGWLAAYVGSALRSAVDVSFRNLGGTATLIEEVFPDVGTLTTRVELTQVSESAGMILQNYSLDVRAGGGGRPIYSGVTSFGFFSKAALADQVGLRGVRPYEPSTGELARAVEPRLIRAPGLELPDTQLKMFDGIQTFVPDGGPKGLGFIRARKVVDPHEWFFAAHFYQDPVWPGSLGLEAFQQLLKVVARERWGDRPGQWRFEPMGVGIEHTWVYRGQVIPSDRKVIIEASVTAIDDERMIVTGDGHLRVDGRTIYAMKGFTLRVRESGPSAVSD